MTEIHELATINSHTNLHGYRVLPHEFLAARSGINCQTKPRIKVSCALMMKLFCLNGGLPRTDSIVLWV